MMLLLQVRSRMSTRISNTRMPDHAYTEQRRTADAHEKYCGVKWFIDLTTKHPVEYVFG
jgi:hypothetical protein